MMLAAYELHAARPTVHSSSLSSNQLQCNSVKINWVSGDGAARVIVAKEGSLPTYTPQDGTVYSGDPSFGGSLEYPSTGDGNFIVYNANGTNFVTVTNLKPGRTYYFVIYEHDNNGNSTEYLTSGAPSISVTTYDIRLDFSFRVIDSCQMTNSFEFTNLSTSTIPGISYRFDFGNGTSTNSPVTHSFTGGGYKNVILSPVTPVTGCPNTFSRNVKIFPKKIGTIDPKTFQDTQCLEGNFFEVQSQSPVQPFPMGVTYRWWFGDGDSSNFPKMRKRYLTSGTFNVMLELTATSYSKPTNCKDTLFFPLTVLPSPVGNIQINDTFQCLKHNGFIFDNPDNTLVFYKWYFGDNDSSSQKTVTHKYDDTGTYNVMHVAFANTGCQGRDTIEIKVLPDLDSRFSGLDTFYCESNTPVQLFPNVAGGEWYDYNVTTGQLTPDVVGNHTLTHIIRDQYCSDTTTKSFRVARRPRPDLGADRAVCNALSMMLDAGEDGTYDWNTRETTKTITVSSTGRYIVEVNIGKCFGSDSVNIAFSTPPKINLGKDTLLCKGSGIWLNASYPNSTYLWSNGSTDSMIYAHQTGQENQMMYKVTVTNPCGSVTDSIMISFAGDNCDLFMANAFSPGNDFLNEVFMPTGRNINVLLFEIYNRWGELVFRTDQNKVGWDGTYMGKRCMEGVYIWKLFYSTENGPYIRKSNASGQVTLLR